jgi:signal transduction histidine kinase
LALESKSGADGNFTMPMETAKGREADRTGKNNHPSTSSLSLEQSVAALEQSEALREQSEALQESVEARFGCLPNFYSLASADPQNTANLWGFAQFAYLDNPLPSLFKERLFVYLSRFCEVRYCIARHLGFLVGLGRTAGDADCPPQTVDAVLPLLRLPLARGDAFEPLLITCQGLDSPIRAFPPPDSSAERALFACAAHVFLQTPEAARAHGALRKVLDRADLEHLTVFLSFVRTAHYWTRLHPGLTFEDDVVEFLKAHEVVRAAILNFPDDSADLRRGQIAAEPPLLRHLPRKNGLITETPITQTPITQTKITETYDTLTVDHRFVAQWLRDRDTTLRDLMAAIPAAVYACDTEGRLIYHNRHATDLWGVEPKTNEHAWAFLKWQRLHRTGGTAIPSEAAREEQRADEEDEPIRGVLASGSPVINQELVLERPDSSRIDVLVNIAPLRDAAGRPRGAVCMMQVISEIKRHQRERERVLNELKRSNHELLRFSHAVAHDLQAPVRSVRALTQILTRRSDGLSQDTAHLADLIEQAAVGMEDMVTSLLKYAQAGHGELVRETVSTESALHAVRVSLSALIEETGARISSSGLPAVKADPVLLQQLFQNLIANAIKYHRPGHPPVIRVEGDRCERGWRFAVADNGQGIPRERQEMIFEPLKRLHGNDTPGSGLGLALCRTIVVRHGGRIWVESDGAGCGATFRFTLGTI